MSQIYTDRRTTIQRLESDDELERLVEVYKPDGRMIAALYEKSEGR